MVNPAVLLDCYGSKIQAIFFWSSSLFWLFAIFVKFLNFIGHSLYVIYERGCCAKKSGPANILFVVIATYIPSYAAAAGQTWMCYQ